MNDLSIIPLKNNLLLDFRHTEIKDKIINRLSELKLLDGKYKLDTEFLSLICNLAEHLVVKKDKLNKKQLVISIYIQLFGLTAEEEEMLNKNIDFLHCNKTIKKVSFYRLFKTSMKEFFLKKV